MVSSLGTSSIRQEFEKIANQTQRDMQELLFQHYTNLKEATQRAITITEHKLEDIAAEASPTDYKEHQDVLAATLNNLTKLEDQKHNTFKNKLANYRGTKGQQRERSQGHTNYRGYNIQPQRKHPPRYQQHTRTYRQGNNFNNNHRRYREHLEPFIQPLRTRGNSNQQGRNYQYRFQKRNFYTERIPQPQRFTTSQTDDYWQQKNNYYNWDYPSHPRLSSYHIRRRAGPNTIKGSVSTTNH